jgi:hypothetical protein
LIWRRIYQNGSWTPFCHVSLRYPGGREYRKRIEKLEDCIKIQEQSAGANDYMRGLYNGLLLAENTMRDDPGAPKYK